MKITTNIICATLLLVGCGIKDPEMKIKDSNSMSQHFCYSNSYGDITRKPNYEQAYYWCSKSAAENIASGQVLLAELYLFGNYVHQDYNKAHELYLKAAKQEHPYAQFRLSQIYEKGLGVEKSEVEAKNWLEKARK